MTLEYGMVKMMRFTLLKMPIWSCMTTLAMKINTLYNIMGT